MTASKTNRLRVLTFVTDLDKGGVQRTAQNFAEAYSELGHDSRVLALASGPRARGLEEAGIAVLTGLGEDTLAELQAWSPDLIHLHAHLLENGEVDRLLDVCNDARVIEKNVFSVPSTWSPRLTASHQLSNWCLRLYEERASRLSLGARATVIPNPVDVSAFSVADEDRVDRLRAELSLPQDALVMGRIGQSFLSKWSIGLIESFEALASNELVHLVLVNPPTEIAVAAHRSRFASRIRIIERIDGDAQLSVAYTLMDVFVHMAEGGESFGNVLLESQLCETPVVTFSTPWADNSQVEVVRNGVGGFVATSRRGFCEATARLLTHPALRASMGKSGRRDAQRFDRLTVAQQVIDLAASEPEVDSQPLVSLAQLDQLYCDAFDDPPRAGRLVLRIPRIRLLLKYISGFKPWWHLLTRPIALPARALVRQFGRTPRHSEANSTRSTH